MWPSLDFLLRTILKSKYFIDGRERIIECAKLRGLRGSRGLEKLRGSWVVGRGSWVVGRG